MTLRQRSRLQLVIGGVLMILAVVLVLPFGCSLLVHWPWLLRFYRGGVVLWNMIYLDEYGFIHYVRLVFAVGLPVLGIGTYVTVRGKINSERASGRRP